MDFLYSMLDVVYDPVEMFLDDALKVAVFAVPAVVIVAVVTLIIIFRRKHK